METENSWHYAPWDINISSDSYVTYEYCTETDTAWNCVAWIQVVPKSSLLIQNQNSTESLSNTAVFVIVIMLLVWLVKWIFRLIIPTKWKRD